MKISQTTLTTYFTSVYFFIKYIFRSFRFELWGDKVKLLDPQNLFEAFESFFELCFAFQLHYPAGRVCDVIFGNVDVDLSKSGLVIIIKYSI